MSSFGTGVHLVPQETSKLSSVSHGPMRHADSAPSVYGSSRLWLRNFQPIKARQWMTFREAKPLSHSIELPYTEGAESACLIGPWDNIKWYWLKLPAPLCQGSRRLPNFGDKSRQNWVAGGFPGGGALVGGLPDHPDGC